MKLLETVMVVVLTDSVAVCYGDGNFRTACKGETIPWPRADFEKACKNGLIASAEVTAISPAKK